MRLRERQLINLFAGLSESPLTDSNRRPPPYHGGFGASHAYTRDHSDAVSPANRAGPGAADASRDVSRVVSDVSVLCPLRVGETDNGVYATQGEARSWALVLGLERGAARPPRRSPEFSSGRSECRQRRRLRVRPGNVRGDEPRRAWRLLPLASRSRGDVSVRPPDLGVQGRRKDVRPLLTRRCLASGQPQVRARTRPGSARRERRGASRIPPQQASLEHCDHRWLATRRRDPRHDRGLI
jgi:hypothetical protein